MNQSEIENKISNLRQEAIILLNRTLKVPDNFVNISLERFVDCILEAATLKASIWNPTLNRPLEKHHEG
jgi:hypothetical protein